MIKFEEYTTQTTDSAFAVCTKESIYKAKLMMVRLSKESEQFVADGKDPRNQISFVFDVLNENNQSVHVATKPTSISFTDKSNLPKLWQNIAELKSGEDLSKLIYDEGGKFRDIYADVYVTVTKKDDKIFNTISKIVGEIEPFPIEHEKLYSRWDFSVYGKECLEFDTATDYSELK